MVQNNIFNEKKMEEFIDIYEDNLVVNSLENHPIENWMKRLDNKELKEEKGNYLNFFEIILENLLGYELDDINYEGNIGGEGRPVEFTLKKDDKDYVVVELKGTKTKDLNKRYNREQSAIEQATNYASVKEETKWAFVSNYDEFRMFNPSYREKYISFRFNELTNKEVLKKFLLVFSKFSLIEKNIPQKLLNETIIMERELEDEFYQLFSETRLMLIKELECQNKDINKDKAIYYAQLILNRYIFICFAEDLGLIPSETTTKKLFDPIESRDLLDNVLWTRLTDLFRTIYKGNSAQKINEFKCSLFEERLDKYIIRDFITENPKEYFKDCYQNWNFKDKNNSIDDILGIYKKGILEGEKIKTINPIFTNLLIISSFDFSSELDVNILGHIFENSIGDIEELKNQSKTRRKKEGIFYTPAEITDYICRNTIIPYLSLSGKINNVNDLIDEYDEQGKLKELDGKIKNIKIIDPACGSGAFLNKAIDILLEIHKKLYDLMYSNDESLDRFRDDLNSRKQIISNNIYGVDVNEESVQITKLSLFLKLATSSNITSGFELPDLDKNIKCGDSIINDKNLVGDKAFNWKEEFQEIFENGGFDIVIGNPPYVRQERIKDYKDYLKNNYIFYNSTADLYVYFFENGLRLLKENGYLSYICSNKYTRTRYGEKLRKKIANEFKIEEYYECNSKLFKATVDTSIIIIQNKRPKNNKIKVNKGEYYLPQSYLDGNAWTIKPPKVQELKNKILNTGRPIKDIPDIRINRGILTGNNKVFVIDEKTKNRLIEEDIKNYEIINPLLKGKNIEQYQKNFGKEYLLTTKNGINVKEEYPKIYDYLCDTDNKLIEENKKKNKKYISAKDRSDRGKHWTNLRNCTYYEDFEKPKILWSEISQKSSFYYDSENYYISNTAYLLSTDEYDLKFLTALFNSNIYTYLVKLISPVLGKKGSRFTKRIMDELPIPNIDDEKQKNIGQYTQDIQDLYKQLKTEENTDKKNEIKLKINNLKIECNQEIYKLFDLTSDEIEIIKNDLKEE